VGKRTKVQGTRGRIAKGLLNGTRSVQSGEKVSARRRKKGRAAEPIEKKRKEVAFAGSLFARGRPQKKVSRKSGNGSEGRGSGKKGPTSGTDSRSHKPKITLARMERKKKPDHNSFSCKSGGQKEDRQKWTNGRSERRSSITAEKIEKFFHRVSYQEAFGRGVFSNWADEMGVYSGMGKKERLSNALHGRRGGGKGQHPSGALEKLTKATNCRGQECPRP